MSVPRRGRREGGLSLRVRAISVGRQRSAGAGRGVHFYTHARYHGGGGSVPRKFCCSARWARAPTFLITRERTCTRYVCALLSPPGVAGPRPGYPPGTTLDYVSGALSAENLGFQGQVSRMILHPLP